MSTDVSTEYLLSRVDRLTADSGAHTARLNTINGQMSRNADAIDKLREDTTAALVDLRDDMVARDDKQTQAIGDLRVDVARHTTRMSVIVGLASLLGTALVSASVGWFVIHQLGPAVRTPQQPATHVTKTSGRTTSHQSFEAASAAYGTAGK